MKRKLYKSRFNRWIFGVCGGLGEFFNVSPMIFRIIFFVFSSFSRVLPAVFIYILLTFIIPTRPLQEEWQERFGGYTAPQSQPQPSENTSEQSRFDEFESFDDIRKNADVVESITEVKTDS